ncbi:uncharacterized protein LOC143374252 [Andrena cerasifolii]|uniref:uncharacterized protein LOC143374252 n=1 Tax=Andrena cerasifolii TaxID=2819439 RepID=UPI004037B6B0
MSASRWHSCHLVRAAPFIFALAHSASLVVVPQDFIELYQQQGVLADRKFIVESVTRYQNQLEQFSKAIPCIGNFLRTNIKEPSRSILMVLDGERGVNEIARSLLMSLKDQFAFLAHTTDVNLHVERHDGTSAVMLMWNGKSMEESFYVLHACSRGCLYVAVLVSKFEDEESFLADADVLAGSMWLRRISILAVLARVGESVLVAGSVAFQPNKPCSPAPAIVLDKCDGAAWKNLTGISSLALNDCILKVAYFEQPPYVVTVNGSENLLGFEGVLIEELTKGLQVERQEVEWSKNTSYSEQVRVLLFNDDTMADLVVGRVLQQSYDNIDYSTTYDMLKTVWVVPKIPNVSLKGLVQPFKPYVWAAIGGTLLLGGIINVFSIRDASWLDIFGLIIGVAIPLRPSAISSKIQFISWSIFGLFLTQLYVDSLADQLMTESHLKFDTMKELVSSSFAIGGTKAFASLFDTFEETDEVIGQIQEKFVTFDEDEYVQQFADLLEGKNDSFALVTVLNSSRCEAIETAYAYTITTDVICSFPIALATWKGFPHLRIIDMKINDFISYGLLDFMIDLAIAKDMRIALFAIAKDNEYKTELHLQQFVPAFLLMVIGFSSGLLFLILEIALHPWKMLE